MIPRKQFMQILNSYEDRVWDNAPQFRLYKDIPICRLKGMSPILDKMPIKVESYSIPQILVGMQDVLRTFTCLLNELYRDIERGAEEDKMLKLIDNFMEELWPVQTTVEAMQEALDDDRRMVLSGRKG